MSAQPTLCCRVPSLMNKKASLALGGVPVVGFVRRPQKPRECNGLEQVIYRVAVQRVLSWCSVSPEAGEYFVKNNSPGFRRALNILAYERRCRAALSGPRSHSGCVNSRAERLAPALRGGRPGAKLSILIVATALVRP